MDQRAIIERRCDSKKYFKQLGKASEIAAKLSKRGDGLTIAYKCLDCDGYHVGHADLSQRLAHQPKPYKETWKDVKARVLLNHCPTCQSKPGQDCTSGNVVNGHSTQITMVACHKGRATNVPRNSEGV